MSRTSYPIYISVIEDGSQLHAVLLSDDSLSQSWTGTTAYPDWSVDFSSATTAQEKIDAANAGTGPVIYIDAQNGVTPTTVTDPEWSYEGTKLTFDWLDNEHTIGLCNNTLYANVFYCAPKSITRGGVTYSVPSLKMVGNLASSINVDEDVISLDANASMNNSLIPFHSTINISITSFSQNGGYACNILSGVASGSYPSQGGYIFTKDSSYLHLYCQLVQSTSGGVVPVGYSDFRVKWKINGSTSQISTSQGPDANYALSTIETYDGRQYYTLIIHKDLIETYAIIDCECYREENNGVYSGLLVAKSVEVNDMSDDTMIYIGSLVDSTASYVSPTSTQEEGEGCSNTIRTTQKVNYDVWIGKDTNPADVKTQFNYFYLLPTTAAGSIYNGTLTGGLQTAIQSGEYKGCRRMGTPIGATAVTGHGKMFITAGEVIDMGWSMRGRIYISTAALPGDSTNE